MFWPSTTAARPAKSGTTITATTNSHQQRKQRQSWPACAQGPRVLETSFLSFQSFPPPLASLFPLRSALSCNFTLRFIYATNVIPPRPRQISSLPHVAGPRRSGSRSICCTLLVLGLGWVGERGPSPLCRASDPLTGGPGERFRRAVLSSCPDLHDLLWDVVSARRLVAILVCCTSTSPPTF
jgi:hypothetical protein